MQVYQFTFKKYLLMLKVIDGIKRTRKRKKKQKNKANSTSELALLALF